MLLAVKDGKNEKFGAGTKQDNMLALKQRRVGRARGELGGRRGRRYGQYNTATVSRHFGRRGGEGVVWA